MLCYKSSQLKQAKMLADYITSAFDKISKAIITYSLLVSSNNKNKLINILSNKYTKAIFN